MSGEAAPVMMQDALPFKQEPHDAMRLGLASLKEDALSVHPVEAIQTEYKSTATDKQFNMMRQLYGASVPAKYQIETQILSKFTRLPGLPSSRLGLESLTGELDDFSFESYLGLPGDGVDAPVEMHSQMEVKLSMGTKQVTRPFL